ncbi:ubiquitin protein ligase [Aureococcus anophagefferens]|nr:ubiquitin protein ligase [Aureococcus anophagefferens]
MPQKHAKNNGSSTYGVFSHTERKQCDFMSSQEARCGSDSQLPFGWPSSRTSYWLPPLTPEAPAKKLAEPPRRPPSPMTGAPLRSKDLYKLDLRKAESAKTSRNDHDGSDVRYLCHVSGDEITTQNVLLIRNTGCVVLEPVATRLGLMKEKRCPVSGAKFKDKRTSSSSRPPSPATRRPAARTSS